jgi:hypothetical protein
LLTQVISKPCCGPAVAMFWSLVIRDGRDV